MRAKRIAKLLSLNLAAILVIGVGCSRLHSPEIDAEEPATTLIGLKELPAVSSDVLAAQGHLFRIEEPFLYDRNQKVATFVVEILSTKHFESETHLIFGGDAKSLQSFANELRLVNAGPSLVGDATQGMRKGIQSLADALWQLLRHPITSVKGLGSAAADLTRYLKGTPSAQVRKDASDLVDAFYINRAAEVAEEHAVDYFDLKTTHGKAAVHSRTNSRLGGQAVVEVASLLVPFSGLKYGGMAVKTAETARLATQMAEVGAVSNQVATFARVGRLFPRMAEKMAATLQRIEYAVPARPITPPVARLGKASSFEYRETFLARYPELEGKVIVHHAIEQQTLVRYPGVLSEAEMHSLENLRGIPLDLNPTVHLRHIRKEWDDFYRTHPIVTKQTLLDKATEIDRKFGHDFQPRLF